MASRCTRRPGLGAGGFLVAVLLALGAGPVLAQPTGEEPDYPHAYPREGVTKRFENERVIIWEVMPHDCATLVLDEDRVRVWDVQLAAGQELPLHVHNLDTVAVILEGRWLDEQRVRRRDLRAHWD